MAPAVVFEKLPVIKTNKIIKKKSLEILTDDDCKHTSWVKQSSEHLSEYEELTSTHINTDLSS